MQENPRHLKMNRFWQATPTQSYYKNKTESNNQNIYKMKQNPQSKEKCTKTAPI